MNVINRYIDNNFNKSIDDKDWDLYCCIYPMIVSGQITKVNSFGDFKNLIHPKEKKQEPKVDYSNYSDEELDEIFNKYFKEE